MSATAPTKQLPLFEQVKSFTDIIQEILTQQKTHVKLEEKEKELVEKLKTTRSSKKEINLKIFKLIDELKASEQYPLIYADQKILDIKDLLETINELAKEGNSPSSLAQEIDVQETNKPEIKLERVDEAARLTFGDKVIEISLEELEYRYVPQEENKEENATYDQIMEAGWQALNKLNQGELFVLWQDYAPEPEENTETNNVVNFFGNEADTETTETVLDPSLKESKELITTKPTKFKINWDIHDGLRIAKVGTFPQQDILLNNIDSLGLLDYFTVQNPGLLTDEELQWTWDNFQTGYPWHQELINKANPKLYEIVKLSNSTLILHDHEQRSLGPVYTNKILAKYKTKRLGGLSQEELKEIWKDLENGEPNASFNQLAKPKGVTTGDEEWPEQIHALRKPDGSVILKLNGRTRKIDAGIVTPGDINFDSQDELNKLWLSDKAYDYNPAQDKIEISSLSGKKPTRKRKPAEATL